ncbi:MAG: helix-turn-helix domain-containing protein [Planctomycetales bacterium]|nr:helix-turn-helix domain-containing protein [Planctomycetales bacterium]
MSNFVTLEEAAKKLGVSADELVEMRSRGEIFGYRDGASWKFKPEEIERVASERMGGALDEDPAGSSILGGGSSVMGDSQLGSDSDDNDVALVADPKSGSDVRLVRKSDDLELASSEDDDDELALAPDEDDLLPAASNSLGSDIELAGSDLELGALGSAVGSDIPISGSDSLDLDGSDPSNVIGSSDLNLAGSEIIKGDSDPGIDSGSLDLLGSDLELSDGSDLVLGGGSDLALGTDSGINLMSPADSGISLEDEPLDLAASGISGLDLAAEGSDVESGSAVDFQQDDEFQLSPSGALDTDDDSGSQVIELEDSSEFGDAAVALPDAGGFDDLSDVDSAGGFDDGGFGEMAPAGAAAVSMAVPEVPYKTWEVVLLLGVLLLMSLSGILVSDIVRNLWAWSGNDSSLTSGFTEMLVSVLGK